MAPTDCCLQVDRQGNSPEQIDNNSQNLSNTLDFTTVHSVSFISNVYKQRFFQPVDFSEKNKQRTSWNQNIKQHPCNHLAMKLVTWSQISNAGENLCKCNEILAN